MPQPPAGLLASGLIDHLSQLSRRLGPLSEPIHAWLAGGFAVHFHTGYRISDGVDIKWSHKFLIPPDMQTFEMDAPGSAAGVGIVVMDGSFTDVMGSFPPEWEERSREVHRFDNLVLHVIDPVDLAVSKVARFSERDREDIQVLAERGLIDPGTFAMRLKEAFDHFVGDMTLVQYNVRDAKEIVASAGIGAPRDAGAGYRGRNDAGERGKGGTLRPLPDDPLAIPDPTRPPDSRRKRRR